MEIIVFNSKKITNKYWAIKTADSEAKKRYIKSGFRVFTEPRNCNN